MIIWISVLKFLTVSLVPGYASSEQSSAMVLRLCVSLPVYVCHFLFYFKDSFLVCYTFLPASCLCPFPTSSDCLPHPDRPPRCHPGLLSVWTVLWISCAFYCEITRVIDMYEEWNLPPVCWVQLSGDHIQGVPSRDTEAIVETEHEDHHWLTGAEPEEEAADAWQHHGASCRMQQDTSFTPQTHKSLIYFPRENCRYNAGAATSKDIKHSIKRKAAIHHQNKQQSGASKTREKVTSYPTCWGARFCPWGGQRQCFLAAQPAFPGSWQNRPSRHCNHRQMSSDSLSCCGGRSCWSPVNLLVWCRQYLQVRNKSRGLLGHKLHRWSGHILKS